MLRFLGMLWDGEGEISSAVNSPVDTFGKALRVSEIPNQGKGEEKRIKHVFFRGAANWRGVYVSSYVAKVNEQDLVQIKK